MLPQPHQERTLSPIHWELLLRDNQPYIFFLLLNIVPKNNRLEVIYRESRYCCHLSAGYSKYLPIHLSRLIITIRSRAIIPVQTLLRLPL